MVHLDVVLADRAIFVRKVKLADLALDPLTQVLRLCDLPISECRIPLTKDCPPCEKPSFLRRVAIRVNLVRLRRDRGQLSRADAAFDGASRHHHLPLSRGECLRDQRSEVSPSVA